MTIGVNHYVDPDAADVDIDNSNFPPEVHQTQEALDYLIEQVQTSASPGFTWGRSGVVSAGSYLLNDGVPSNNSGRTVPIASGEIKEIFVAVKTAGNYEISVEKRVGSVFTEIAYVTLSGVRVDSFPVSVLVTYKDELAVRVRSTSPSNPADPVVGLIIKGYI